MEISFFGATQMVTGSCYLITLNKTKILVDCGMFQGNKKVRNLNYVDFPFNPKEIDYLLLTHAHIDHSGRIPGLFKNGFKGVIICNNATYDLCDIMLHDSAHIQEVELEWKNRKRKRRGQLLLEPLYTHSDVEECMKLFKTLNYDEMFKMNDNIKIMYRNSGHMLGSAIIEIWVNENSKEKKYVFTGDLGNFDQPLLKDPQIIKSTDYLIMESTYGDRLHSINDDMEDELLKIIIDTAKKGGNIIIPSFAIGRTQEVLYQLNKYKENGSLGKYDKIPVYVDSPLAIKATEVFKKNYCLYDKEAKELLDNGDDPLVFHNLNFTITADESKSINSIVGSKIIIASSGMCDAGRIRHHLKHNIWKKNSALVFVGYQAKDTLGYNILNGIKSVRLFGEDIQVNASIHKLNDYSSHADLNGLLNWIENMDELPRKIVLIHGDKEAMNNLKNRIIQRFNSKVIIPSLGDKINLSNEEEFIESIDIDINDNGEKNILKELKKLSNRFENISLNSEEIDKIQYNIQIISNIIKGK
ncbi:MAG: MBL fold metallo-hydrolase RNA specificity domain-containing protein [Eubacteriaceae bacterium]